jgi:ribosomal protein S18 acetylase RimI-like enzyme
MTEAIELKVGSEIAEEALLALYNSVNWTVYTNEANRDKLGTAVRNSTYVVSAWKDEELVGLARVLSDDVSIFYLQDILVRPEYQGMGIGRKLLGNCLERFDHVRAKVLMTDNEERQLKFYKSMGFENTREITRFTLNVFVKM